MKTDVPERQMLSVRQIMFCIGTLRPIHMQTHVLFIPFPFPFQILNPAMQTGTGHPSASTQTCG